MDEVPFPMVLVNAGDNLDPLGLIKAGNNMVNEDILGKTGVLGLLCIVTDRQDLSRAVILRNDL